MASANKQYISPKVEYQYKLGVELKFNLESFQTEVIVSCKENTAESDHHTDLK